MLILPVYSPAGAEFSAVSHVMLVVKLKLYFQVPSGTTFYFYNNYKMALLMKYFTT